MDLMYPPQIFHALNHHYALLEEVQQVFPKPTWLPDLTLIIWLQLSLNQTWDPACLPSNLVLDPACLPSSVICMAALQPHELIPIYYSLIRSSLWGPSSTSSITNPDFKYPIEINNSKPDFLKILILTLKMSTLAMYLLNAALKRNIIANQKHLLQVSRFRSGSIYRRFVTPFTGYMR